MNKFSTSLKINLCIFIFALLFFSMDFSGSGNIQGFEFNQLDKFFEDNLFGVKFDYNSESPKSEALNLISDIVTGENFSTQNDPDPTTDNILALVGHESRDIFSAFFAVENVKRREFIPLLDFIEWQASLPFVKNLILYDLPSKENAIIAQDFLGMALRLDGQAFDYNHYQVGYANIPYDFLEFFTEALISGSEIQEKIETDSEISQISINSSTSPMSISVSNTENELTVKTTYFNTTYLFQTKDVDFEQIASFDLSDHFLMLQFDEIEISISLLKYSNSMTSGVESHVGIRVGNVINLIINEKRPQEETWSQSSEKHIETNYNGIFDLNDTFSWYRGEEIAQRLSLFNKTSLSLFISQNVGILDGKTNNDNFKIMLSGENISKEALAQNDYPVSDDISILHNEETLVTTIIDGYDFALEENPLTKTSSIIPTSVNLIALNQHPSLSNNILFLRETSLINELVAETVKRFVDNDSLSELSTDQLLKIAKLYMTAAVYIQDIQITDWVGFPTSIISLSTAIRKSDNKALNLSKISDFSPFPGVFSVLILVIYRKTRNSS